MEGFRKSSTTAIPNENLVESSIPVMRVTQGGKVKGYIAATTKLLNTHPQLFIVGVGEAVSKAVSISELASRKLDCDLEQKIFEVCEKDLWCSLHGLDDIEVTRHLPAIKITVSKRLK